MDGKRSKSDNIIDELICVKCRPNVTGRDDDRKQQHQRITCRAKAVT